MCNNKYGVTLLQCTLLQVKNNVWQQVIALYILIEFIQIELIIAIGVSGNFVKQALMQHIQLGVLDTY